MNTSFNHGSAKIYQFPVRARATLGHAGHDDSAANRSTSVSEIACGDSWYHEEAVRESERVRKA